MVLVQQGLLGLAPVCVAGSLLHRKRRALLGELPGQVSSRVGRKWAVGMGM